MYGYSSIKIIEEKVKSFTHKTINIIHFFVNFRTFRALKNVQMILTENQTVEMSIFTYKVENDITNRILHFKDN